MAPIVLVVPVLAGAFLLLMEWFEARLLGVALSADVDSDPVRPDSHHAAASCALRWPRVDAGSS
jgi:hypothetical protein